MGVGCGTAAIEIALRLSGITRREQEVITSPLTAPFTAHAIVAAGATPVFADIDPSTLLLDPARVAEKITPRTAAILPVHLYGQCCDLDALAPLARKCGAVLIEDACQAHGALYDGRPLGAGGRLVAYSFYPTKNLPCLGDGGALLVNDAEQDRRARLFRDGARGPGHVAQFPALNSRLDEIQAALLHVFLRYLDDWNSQRRRLAQIYDRELAEMEDIRPVGRNPQSTHVMHLYVVRAKKREQLQRFLAEQGIGTGIHYPVPLHRQPAFQTADRCPVAEQAVEEILSLPLWPFLAEEDVGFVTQQIRAFYSR